MWGISWIKRITDESFKKLPRMPTAERNNCKICCFVWAGTVETGAYAISRVSHAIPRNETGSVDSGKRLIFYANIRRWRTQTIVSARQVLLNTSVHLPYADYTRLVINWVWGLAELWKYRTRVSGDKYTFQGRANTFLSSVLKNTVKIKKLNLLLTAPKGATPVN